MDLDRWTWQNLDVLENTLERCSSKILRITAEDRTGGSSATIGALNWNEEELARWSPAGDADTAVDLADSDRVAAAVAWVRQSTASVTVSRPRTFSIRMTDGRRYLTSVTVTCTPVAFDAASEAAPPAATPPTGSDAAITGLVRTTASGAEAAIKVFSDRIERMAEMHVRQLDGQQRFYDQHLRTVGSQNQAQLEQLARQIDAANARVDAAYEHRDRLVARVVELQTELTEARNAAKQELELARQQAEVAKSFIDRVGRGVELVAAGKLDLDPRMVRLAEVLREAPEEVREAVLQPELADILRQPELARGLAQMLTRFTAAWRDAQAAPTT